MDFQFVRIKSNQAIPPGSHVVSIIVTGEGLRAVVGRHGVGPGGTGWIESQPVPVRAALEEAKSALQASVAASGRVAPSVFVYFHSNDQWDPLWGEWTWLRRSGAPLPRKG